MRYGLFYLPSSLPATRAEGSERLRAVVEQARQIPPFQVLHAAEVGQVEMERGDRDRVRVDRALLLPQRRRLDERVTRWQRSTVAPISNG